MHFHRARRRTRQVFRRKPNMSVIVATMLIVIMCFVIYFFAIYPPSEGDLEISDEGTFGDEETNTQIFSEENTDVLIDVEAKSTPPVVPARSWPIDIIIPDNITMINIYGDTSQDTILPGDCSLPIKDAKRDVEREFRYNVKAQEEFAKIETRYEQEKEKIREAHEDLVVKRRKLDAIRISCIENKKPFDDPFNEFLNVMLHNLKE